jgi:NADH-quinone oxidoreductase subunit N
MPALSPSWQQILILAALASMAIGNIVAIMQTNLKRMLAYSSIAHMGYMSLGLLANSKSGYAAALFYIIIYALMSLGAFAIIIIMSRIGFEADSINDLKGLNTRNPWLALMMLLIMFSMAGIPPMAGFFAKLGVLEALISAHFVWLAAVALVFAVIGSYYYLAIVKVMYFEEPVDRMPVAFGWDMNLAITANGLAVLLLGFFPTAIINLCRAAV